MRQIRENTGKLRDEELELLDFITDAHPPMARMAYPGNYRLKTLDQDLSYASMCHSNSDMEYFIPLSRSTNVFGNSRSIRWRETYLDIENIFHDFIISHSKFFHIIVVQNSRNNARDVI